MSGRGRGVDVNLLVKQSEKEHRKYLGEIRKELSLNNEYLKEFKKIKKECLGLKVEKIAQTIYSEELEKESEIFLNRRSKVSDLNFMLIDKKLKRRDELEYSFKEHSKKVLKMTYGTRDELNAKFLEIKKDLKALLKDIEKIVATNLKVLNSLKAEEYTLKNMIQNLNKQINSAVENEDKFIYITNTFKNINEEKASKYMGEVFQRLKNDFEKINSKNIETEYEIFKIKLRFFTETLEKKEQSFLQQKYEIENLIKEIGLIKECHKLNDIYSYMEGKTEEITIFEFAKRYKIEVDEFALNNKVEAIKENLKNENFELALSLAKNSLSEFEEAIDIITNEYDRILNQVLYTKSVIKAGAKLGYSISAEIDKNGLQNGVNIKMTMGDEIIEFEPRINSNGDISLDINHKESIKNDCSRTMNNIMQALKENGILLKDIIGDDGSSILVEDKLSSKNTFIKKEKLSYK